MASETPSRIDQTPAPLDLWMVKGDSFERIVTFRQRAVTGVRSDLNVSAYDWEGEIGGQSLAFTAGPSSNQVTMRLTNAQSALLEVGETTGFVRWAREGATEDEIRTVLSLTVDVRES